MKDRERAASAVDRILERLSPWLDVKRQEWFEQDEGARTPTLPHRMITDKNTGVLRPCLNLTHLIDAAGLKPADQKWLRTREALTSAINEIAEEQGVVGIGLQQQRDAMNQAAREEVVTAKSRRQISEENLVEALAEIQQLKTDRDYWRDLVLAIYRGEEVPDEVVAIAAAEKEREERR